MQCFAVELWSKIHALPLWLWLLTLFIFVLWKCCCRCLRQKLQFLSFFIVCWFVFLFWALLLLLFLQHSAQTETSFNLLLPGSQQGKLYPPWGLRLLPSQPPEALAPFHGHVVPKPQRFSDGRSLQPGVGLLPGLVGCRQALSSRRCVHPTGGRELERGLGFLLTHFVLYFRQRPFPFHTGLR